MIKGSFLCSKAFLWLLLCLGFQLGFFSGYHLRELGYLFIFLIFLPAAYYFIKGE